MLRTITQTETGEPPKKCVKRNVVQKQTSHHELGDHSEDKAAGILGWFSTVQTISFSVSHNMKCCWPMVTLNLFHFYRVHILVATVWDWSQLMSCSQFCLHVCVCVCMCVWNTSQLYFNHLFVWTDLFWGGGGMGVLAIKWLWHNFVLFSGVINLYFWFYAFSHITNGSLICICLFYDEHFVMWTS